MYDLAGSGAKYGTAENLALFPTNDPETVGRAARVLGVDGDMQACFCFGLNANYSGKVSKGPSKHPFPTPCTVEQALTAFCDLTGPVKKKMLVDFAGFCADSQQREEL